ncbi:hypothetical protein IQ06DRAFT_337903 [Phaeosphaeriaceae sp. SRC1lsM3a]|nr:hypothetical protein IQ06DRAFT_337903 [Stagonospora sp. SRC1lsM3a]
MASSIAQVNVHANPSWVCSNQAECREDAEDCPTAGAIICAPLAGPLALHQPAHNYNNRVGRAVPAGPGAALSLQNIAAWPTTTVAPGNAQDFCTCLAVGVTPFEHNSCHACRDEFFEVLVTNAAYNHADFLSERRKEVINGTSQCDANGGTEPKLLPRRILNQHIANGLGRACPCGEPPDGTAHFIDFCLSCQGVKVYSNLIPRKYQRDRVLTGRPSTRSRDALPTAGAAAGNELTKGPRRANRRWDWRVNIKFGFLDTLPSRRRDPYIDGA